MSESLKTSHQFWLKSTEFIWKDRDLNSRVQKKKLSGSRSWTNSWVICPNKNIHSVIFYSDSHAFLASSHEMDALVLLIIGTEKPLRQKSVSSVLFQISFLSWFVWFLLALYVVPINVRSEKKYSKRSSNKLLYLLYFFSERTLSGKSR